MSVVITKPVFKRTEESKQESLREQLAAMKNECLKGDGYYLKMPVFFIINFMKFTPAAKRLQFCEKQGDFVIKNHTLYYQARATAPYPLWGSAVHAVDSKTGYHETLWSLPQLARNSPIYTYNRAVKAGRPKIELIWILEMINGTLERRAMSYNLGDAIEQHAMKLFNQGEIPLVTYSEQQGAYVPYEPTLSLV